MAFKEYVFSGKAAWVSTKPQIFDDKEKWGMAFYPRTAADRKEIVATGIKNKSQIDGEKGQAGIEDGLIYFRLRNDKEAYKIIDATGSPITELVGNGSDVTIKLLVETFNSPKFGPQARSWLTEVVVTNLIPYVPEDKSPVGSSVASGTSTGTMADLPV